MESGQSVKEIYRKHSISDAIFYNWKAKYGSMRVADEVRIKDL